MCIEANNSLRPNFKKDLYPQLSLVKFVKDLPLASNTGSNSQKARGRTVSQSVR